MRSFLDLLCGELPFWWLPFLLTSPGLVQKEGFPEPLELPFGGFVSHFFLWTPLNLSELKEEATQAI